MKDLTQFYKAIHTAAIFARQKISDPRAARKALAYEERLAKLAATSGKSGKPVRRRTAAKAA